MLEITAEADAAARTAPFVSGHAVAAMLPFHLSSWLPWMPPNGSLHGVAVDRLMYINLFALSVCFVLAHLLLAVAILRRRPDGQAPRLWIVETFPIFLLCCLYLWMTVTAQKLWAANRFEGASPGAMQAEVVGVQFQWYFRYPGHDAEFGDTKPQLVDAAGGNPLGIDPADERGTDDVVTSELVLPAGREVDLRLRAHDVIHGFFIPAMRVKQNAVPGMVLHIHFTPEIPGEYPILCSQVCGLGHGRMQAKLRVLAQPDFDEWLAQREARQHASEPTHGGSQ